MFKKFFFFFRQSQLESLVQNSVKKALKESRLTVQPEPLPLNRQKVIRTIRSLALALGYSKSHVHRMVHSGRIPFYRNPANGKLIFDPAEVLKAFSRGNTKKHTL